jgi:hypothetical protein
MSDKSIPHRVVDEFIARLSEKQTVKEASLETLKAALYSGQATKEDIKSILLEDLKNEDS